MGAFAWELDFFRLATLASDRLLGSYRLGSLLWKLLLALRTSCLEPFREGTFAWDRSLGIRHLESFEWNRSLRDSR